MGFDLDKAVIGVIGLGYVGLPLAVAFGERRQTVGFDVSQGRIAELRDGRDSTREVEADELARARHLSMTADPADLTRCNVYVVTVPTPIDSYKRPDLGPLQSASRTLGKVVAPGDVVIYESTVFPGATEEVCVPILEAESGLTFNKDFFVGYSPERINPGDKTHRLATITKVTSGSTPETADFVDALYNTVVAAGTHRASSIKVAEAAKVIENTQRDLNIALINELAIIFAKLGIDTREVLEAAGSKWNFLPFRPGLVGGHCIGVDPYYLTHKAEEIGYRPEVILAGRRINDGMGAYIAGELMRIMNHRRVLLADARILVLGLTFKENCPDLRNSRVFDLVRALEGYDARVDVYDPWVEDSTAEGEHPVSLVDAPEKGAYDALVLAVGHDTFKELGAEGIRGFGRDHAVLYDVKSVFPRDVVDARL